MRRFKSDLVATSGVIDEDRIRSARWSEFASEGGVEEGRSDDVVCSDECGKWSAARSRSRCSRRTEECVKLFSAVSPAKNRAHRVGMRERVEVGIRHNFVRRIDSPSCVRLTEDLSLTCASPQGSIRNAGKMLEICNRRNRPSHPATAINGTFENHSG